MMNSVLLESPRVRHPQEKCASKCVRGFVPLCLHLFCSTNQFYFACVAEQQKHLTVNQASSVDFVGASPTTCTKRHGGVATEGHPYSYGL